MTAPLSQQPPGRIAARLCVAGVITLVLLIILWELALAPLRPGGSWLVLKALPLALLVPGVARGNGRARTWLALLLPWYAAEGITRAFSEHGRHAVLAGSAAILAAATFSALYVWYHAQRQSENPLQGGSRS